MAKYSEAELRYCDVIATALIAIPAFRAWLVNGGQLGERLASASIDPERQRSFRSKVPDGDRWWFNYWAGSGPGIETDILIIFNCQDGHSVAIHVEVKTENDGLREGQAEGYRRRARTWADADTRPKAVVPHHEAYTVFIAAKDYLMDPRVRLFDFARSHVELRKVLPSYPRG